MELPRDTVAASVEIRVWYTMRDTLVLEVQVDERTLGSQIAREALEELATVMVDAPKTEFRMRGVRQEVRNSTRIVDRIGALREAVKNAFNLLRGSYSEDMKFLKRESEAKYE